MRGMLAPVFECYEPAPAALGRHGPHPPQAGCLYVIFLAKRQANGNSNGSAPLPGRRPQRQSAPTSLPNSNLTWRAVSFRASFATDNGSTLRSSAWSNRSMRQALRDGATLCGQKCRISRARRWRRSSRGGLWWRGRSRSMPSSWRTGAWSVKLARKLGSGRARWESQRGYTRNA